MATATTGSSERLSVRPSLRLFDVAARKRGSIDADEMKGETGRELREEGARVTREGEEVRMALLGSRIFLLNQ